MSVPNNNLNFGILDAATPYLKDEFAKYGSLINFDRDDNPFYADNTLEYFYIVASGKIKVYEINFDTNREQTLYMLIRGDMFDVVTLLDNTEHNLATEVLENGVAIRFPIYKVREWIDTFPDFKQLIFRYVAMQMRSVEELAIDISLHNTKDRLLKLLLKNIEMIDKRGVDILSKLSHTEIANLIGTVRHIVDRHIKELKKEGVIEDKKRALSIKNAKKVLEMLKSY